MTTPHYVSAQEMAGRRIKAEALVEAFRKLASPTVDPADIDWPEVLAYASVEDDAERGRRWAAATALAAVRKPSDGTVKVALNMLHERAHPAADPFAGF